MLKKSFPMGKIPYEKKCKLRIVLSIFVALAGVTAVALMLLLKSSEGAASDFMQGFYTGSGGGLFGAGVATIIIQLCYLKNAELRKKQELKENDERNIFVAARAAQFSFYICIYGLYLAVIITGMFNPAAAAVMLIVLVTMFLVWLISYLICNKLY